MDIFKRNNVKVGGEGTRTIMFAHGFGCDQNMWRFVEPEFRNDHRTVLFDNVGAGGSDLAAYDPSKYETLNGYTTDVIELARALEMRDAVFVGHSVSAMIGVLATIEAPELFSELVLVGPSPRYIDDDGYSGGFTQSQIEELLDFLDDNYLGWSRAMAPVIMGNSERAELGEELTNSFCQTDPEIAKQFAKATFLSDNREDLAKCAARALVLQCSADVIAPEVVGRYVHTNLPNAEFVQMEATGHCPNLSAPQETSAAIRAFLRAGA